MASMICAGIKRKLDVRVLSSAPRKILLCRINVVAAFKFPIYYVAQKEIRRVGARRAFPLRASFAEVATKAEQYYEGHGRTCRLERKNYNPERKPKEANLPAGEAGILPVRYTIQIFQKKNNSHSIKNRIM